MFINFKWNEMVQLWLYFLIPKMCRYLIQCKHKTKRLICTCGNRPPIWADFIANLDALLLFPSNYEFEYNWHRTIAINRYRQIRVSFCQQFILEYNYNWKLKFTLKQDSNPDFIASYVQRSYTIDHCGGLYK